MCNRNGVLYFRNGVLWQPSGNLRFLVFFNIYNFFVPWVLLFSITYWCKLTIQLCDVFVWNVLSRTEQSVLYTNQDEHLFYKSHSWVNVFLPPDLIIILARFTYKITLLVHQINIHIISNIYIYASYHFMYSS